MHAAHANDESPVNGSPVSIAYMFLDLLLAIPNALVGLHIGKQCGYVVHNTVFVVHVGFGGHFSKEHQVGAGFFAPSLLRWRGSANSCWLARSLRSLSRNSSILNEVGDVGIEDGCFEFLDVVVGVDVFAGLIFNETDNDGGLRSFGLHVFFEAFAVRELGDHFIGDDTRVGIVPAATEGLFR